ncbi:MAG: N-acetyltransferase, partial [Halobaculum sp.]
MIRRGRETDAAALRQLQSQLREPSPALLRHALSAGTVFVSAVDAGDTTAVAAGDTTAVAAGDT